MWTRSTSGDWILLQTTGAPHNTSVNPFAFLLIGTQQLNIPLPPTQCPLLTDFPFANMIPIVNSSNQTRFLAPSLGRITLLAQTITTSPGLPLKWRTSNGVRIRLP